MFDFSKINEIKNKQDFISFVESLALDFRANPLGWENRKVDSYLEAIASWTEDMDGFYRNNNLEAPQNVDWKVFASILIAAKMFE